MTQSGLVASPSATGSFDVAQAPLVTVCQVSAAECATLIVVSAIP